MDEFNYSVDPDIQGIEAASLLSVPFTSFVIIQVTYFTYSGEELRKRPHEIPVLLCSMDYA